MTTITSATNALIYPSGRCESPMTLGLVGGVGRLADDPPLGIAGSEALVDRTYIERVIDADRRSLFTLRSLTRVSR